MLLADTISRAWTLDAEATNKTARVPHTQGILVETRTFLPQVHHQPGGHTGICSAWGQQHCCWKLRPISV